MTKQQIQMMPRQAAPKPLTEEEKKAKIMQFVQQKREGFAINILCNMCHAAITNKDVTNVQIESLVDIAVKMADALMDKLYPMPENEEKK